MNQEVSAFLKREISDWKRNGTFRKKRSLHGPQGGLVNVDGKEVVMLSSNNYLGLASHPKIVEAASHAIDKYCCGTASVTEVCGLTELHNELQNRISVFTGTESALLYSSCSTANIGVIDCLMTDGDVIFSDQFNHASIIDGCRITKAKTVVYPHNDMKALEKALKENDGARRKMIITDGVFSMEGDTAPLDIVVELGERFNAIKVVDESHAIGVVGRGGIGTGELYGVQDRIDIFTGTFGKALGGAGGGYLCGSRDMTDYLYHRSRPFIFTNALPPATVAVGIAALEILENDSQCLETLWDNTRYFRDALEKIGLKLLGGESPIIPVLIGDTAKAYQMSNELFDLGVFITAIGYPVVSSDEARLRVQISAALGKRDLDVAIHSIDQTAQKLGIGKYEK
jgi:glycine C-acetyltransferase